MTPFYLIYKRNPQMPYMEIDEIIEGNILDQLYTLIETLPNNQEIAQKNIQKAQKKQKG